ncbi:MAG: YciI family protein [Pseudomonadales bacterium]|nr:YciI family protein [Pseudomonadales bacterium]
MQYLLMIYQAEEIWESKSDDEKSAVLARHRVLNEKLQADGITFAAEPLQSTATAVCLRNRNGDMQVSDGPFAETKEQLAGFYLVDVETMEDAMAYAAMIPSVDHGTIEVRAVADHSST